MMSELWIKVDYHFSRTACVTVILVIVVFAVVLVIIINSELYVI